MIFMLLLLSTIYYLLDLHLPHAASRIASTFSLVSLSVVSRIVVSCLNNFGSA